MARLSKLIAALLHLEKENPDRRKVIVFDQEALHQFKIKKVIEDEEKVLLLVEEME